MSHDTHEHIAKYVEDLHSLVQHGLQPLGQQLSESTGGQHASAAHLIQELKNTLEQQELALRQRMQALGTSPTTGVQDAAATVAGGVAGLYNRVRTEAVSKSVRDDYTFLSHCGVSWLMLMATARSLNDHETEELAESGYRDTARLIIQIDRLMPDLVVEELRQDQFSAQDVSAWAHRIVSDAWNREASSLGSAAA
jgi:hypothetical protein